MYVTLLHDTALFPQTANLTNFTRYSMYYNNVTTPIIDSTSVYL